MFLHTIHCLIILTGWYHINRSTKLSGNCMNCALYPCIYTYMFMQDHKILVSKPVILEIMLCIELTPNIDRRRTVPQLRVELIWPCKSNTSVRHTTACLDVWPFASTYLKTSRSTRYWSTLFKHSTTLFQPLTIGFWNSWNQIRTSNLRK